MILMMLQETAMYSYEVITNQEQEEGRVGTKGGRRGTNKSGMIPRSTQMIPVYKTHVMTAWHWTLPPTTDPISPFCLTVDLPCHPAESWPGTHRLWQPSEKMRGAVRKINKLTADNRNQEQPSIAKSSAVTLEHLSQKHSDGRAHTDRQTHTSVKPSAFLNHNTVKRSVILLDVV